MAEESLDSSQADRQSVWRIGETCGLVVVEAGPGEEAGAWVGLWAPSRGPETIPSAAKTGQRE